MSMIGKTIAHFEITGQLGKGGMGEVYQAKDRKLGRDVAIKVLPEEFVKDADRVARFQREAKLLASLNHPNIAAIYGLEEAGGTNLLVLELVEGQTLADRIKAGQVPVEEALKLALQIAEALEAAHEKGVIHRDLKPANIKVTPDGKVKVLDFGLAKAFAGDQEVNLSNSPTLSNAATQQGIILGTAAYMSPEQARGAAVDKRTDIWAFGVVLFEMLTGKCLFAGDTVSDTLAAVLTRQPDWSLLPPGTPWRLRDLLAHCLERNPRRRLRDIGDACVQMEESLSAPGGALAAIPQPWWRRVALAVAAAIAGGAIVGTLVWVATRSIAPSAPELRLDITTPPTADPESESVSIAISPDGRRVVFAATPEGRTQLWIRSLDDVAAQPLAGTDNATLPFWSPDSRSVGFFADEKLKRIDIAAGSVKTLADARDGRGGTWNRDGTILFAPNAVGPISRISAAGGKPAVLTHVETDAQTDHRSPQFLPDGRHFLYYARGTPEGRGVYVGQLDGTHSQRLLDADAAAVYASTGHILFVRQGALYAERFDLDRLALVGDSFQVAQQVIVSAGISIAALSASQAGPIIYCAGPIAGQLVWTDRSGKVGESIGDAGGVYLSPSLSPDERRVAVARNVSSNWDVWLIDTARGMNRRLTSHPAVDGLAVWSPDGSHIVFSSARRGSNMLDLYTMLVSGTGGEELLLETPGGGASTDWSSDGRFLLYHCPRLTTRHDLWALPMDGNKKPFPVAQSTFNELNGQFSADGKWIAYQSDESGRSEIYVQPFPGPGDKTQVSTAGGGQVRWRADGKELFYIALDGHLMAVPIRLPSNGGTVDIGRPVRLFPTHIRYGVLTNYGAQYAVAPDGQRFLMNTVTEETHTISVILNWKPKG
jgi:serine/threonine protein kinase/Tol biopolymer transport system component